MSIDDALRDKMVDVARMIQRDVAADSARREDLPLTGRNVAVALGEICAQVGTLARMIEVILTDGGERT